MNTFVSTDYPLEGIIGVFQEDSMSKNKIIPYRSDLKIKARDLRKNSTLSEILLWQEIQHKQLKGYQFHRQVPMLDYIVDFYCHELMLAIELDGESHYHDLKPQYDQHRQKRLEAEGVRFLRFDDRDVKKQMSYVLNTIIQWMLENENHNV